MPRPLRPGQNHHGHGRTGVTMAAEGRVVIPSTTIRTVPNVLVTDQRDSQVACPCSAGIHRPSREPSARAISSEWLRTSARRRKRPARTKSPQLAMNPLDRRVVILFGIVKPHAALLTIGFPVQHPFRPDAEHKTDTSRAINIPKIRVAQGRFDAPVRKLIEWLLRREANQITLARNERMTKLCGDPAGIIVGG